MKFIFTIASITIAFTAAGQEAFAPGPERTHSESIASSDHRYSINVGGTADMDRTMTRSHAAFDIAFQNNVSLRIANTGSAPVVNPRVIINDRLKFHSSDSMLQEFIQHAETDQDKVYLIYEGIREHRHHDMPHFADADFHDPVRFLCVYGGGFCDDSGMVGAALYEHAGFTGPNGEALPFVRALHGHMMCEVWHDGDYQWMDIDQDTFFLDRENRKPVSGDMAVRDHDYAKRELAYGPGFSGWKSSHNNAALFGVDDERVKGGSVGHTLEFTLRPGEAIEYRWDNKGKWPWREYNEEHRYYGNSMLQYAPLQPQAIESFQPMNARRVQVRDGQLQIPRGTSEFTVPVRTPYTVCGAMARIAVDQAHYRNAITIEVSRNQEEWLTIAHDDDAAAAGDMTEALGVAGGLPIREFFVRFSFDVIVPLVVTDLYIGTDIYAYPIALPRLSVGENACVYTDDTEGDHAVEITHTWRESDAIASPTPPTAPVSPAKEAVIRDTYVPFAWPAVEGCDMYHLTVSRRPDFAYPYRPNYDVMLKTNEYTVPFRGMFSTGETYYWRVRPRLAQGLWGDWSGTFTFTWEGPMVPRDVRIEQSGGEFVLRWTQNPNGTLPVRYEIYGSTERGFSVNPYMHSVVGRGDRVPGNRIATIDARGELAYAITGPESYWRVVAIDARGVESCPSDYAEAPHPYIYTAPVTEATVDEGYMYRAKTFQSIGDYQHRYEGNDYWERESYAFALKDSPEWLTIDAATGVVQGTPPEEGEFPVTIEITSTYAHEVDENAKSANVFMKRGEEWTKTAVQSYKLNVTSP